MHSQTSADESPRDRQKKYEAQVSQAIADGHFAKMLWAELARDYNAAIANILHMWRQVDVHYAANQSPPRDS